MQTWVTYMIIGMVAFAAGEYFSKLYANSPKFHMALAAFLCYISGTMTWLQIIKNNNQLIVMSIVWAIASILVSIAVGKFVFDEQLTTQQWIGVALSFVTIYLLTK